MKIITGLDADARSGRRRGGWVLVLLTLLATGTLAALYLVPEEAPTTNELYSAVDTRVFNSLQRFRTDHPPQELDVGGVVWRYLRTGDGPETIVLLHDIVGSGDVWWQEASDLARDYSIILPTLPGLASLDPLADGLVAILDEEGVDSAHFVGTSLGGHLAQFLLGEHPERVRTLILSNAFPPSDQLAAQYGPWAAAARYVPARMVRRAMRESIENQWLPASGSSELLRAYLREQVAYRPPTMLLARYRAATEYFLPPDPAKQRVPVVIMESSNDPVVPAEVRASLRDSYPGARVIEMGPVGHYPQVTRPAMYAGHLREVLSAPRTVSAVP